MIDEKDLAWAILQDRELDYFISILDGWSVELCANPSQFMMTVYDALLKRESPIKGLSFSSGDIYLLKLRLIGRAAWIDHTPTFIRQLGDIKASRVLK